jgi:hypothetical protein
LSSHPVAAVQYTFTHKQYTELHNQHKQYIEQHSRHQQYTEQHNRHKQYTEQHSRNKQYIEQHNSLIRKSAGRAPSLQGIPWHLSYNWGKARKTTFRVVGECQLAKSIQNRTNMSIKIHKHNKEYITYRIKQKCTKPTAIYKYKTQ